MKKIYFVLLFMVLILSASTQEIRQMEFVNQSIKDILFTLAETTGFSIIADDTVDGQASYHFSDTNLDSALEHFLDPYDLYFWKKDGIYYVSKIMVEFNNATGAVTLFAKNVEPRLILEKISKEIKSTILFDALPREKLTVNADSLPISRVIEIVMHRFTDYEVQDLGDYYYIKRLATERNNSPRSAAGAVIEEKGLFSISADSIRLSDVLTQLFSESGTEYSMMKRGDFVLENIHFKNKTFDELLRLILEQADGDFTVRRDIYYIFDVSKNEIMKKMDDIEFIKLDNIPVELLPSLFPAGLASSSIFKIDKDNNAVILSGSFEETTPVREFITKLEAEYEEKQVSKLDLSFITVDELLKLLPSRLQKLQVVRTGNSQTLILEAAKEQIADFTSFMQMIDIHGEGLAIPLKYIRADDLLENLPPSISETDIVKSVDPNLIFFKGSKEKLERFLKDLEYIDKPIPQIRYELLVVQYQESKNKEFGLSVSNEISQSGDQTSLLGSLGNLVNLNLDIVTTFGYLFAIDLNAKISDSEARIMADTTLNGLTGEDISFQNTNTYRYRDMEIDPDTGEAQSTGVTREITSGLIISINGWVSGDDMITMDVKSTVSKRGADVSSSTGNPPPTSEKVISTHVRTPSGKPVIISGLLQQERDVITQKTPILSSIPLFGWLFTSEVETFENTELIIYIVPYIEYPERERLASDRVFKEYFKSFFAGKDSWN
jgi:general secretion pathway protein D